MFRLLICGWIVLVLGGPPLATGQQATPPQPATKPVDKQAMYEDIEVMRRIFNGQIGHLRMAAQERASVTDWLVSDGRCTSCHPVADVVGWAYPDEPNHRAHTDGKAAPPDETAKRAMNYLGLSLRDPENLGHGRTIANWSGLLSYYYDALNLPTSGHQRWLPRAARGPAFEFEGAYLKGHGVAYTATIAAADVAALPTPPKSGTLLTTCGKCHETGPLRKAVEPSAETAAKEPSLWDKVRRDVRGETATPTTKPADRVRRQDICTPGTLAESILELLAEHGHNFRQLPASESISVVVTLPPAPQPAAEKPAPKAEQPAALRTAKQLIDLAELHVKQGKHAEAERTLADAIKRLSELTVTPDTPRDFVFRQVEEAQQLLRGAHTLRAQVLLAQGQLQEASAALEKAKSPSITVSGVDGLAALEPQPASPALPRKLVVTVSKKLLDQVHAKQIDLEQFRKAAEVEGVSLAPPKK